MQLFLDNLSLRVLQMGADFLLVEGPVNHPPTIARVSLRVDNSESDWAIRLPDGVSANTDRVAIEAVA